MRKSRGINSDGLTLIELILTLALFGIITLIVYPMLSFTYKTATQQLKESNQRNEVRVVSTHLKNDIEYSKNIAFSSPSSLQVVNSKGENISYYITTNPDTGSYLVRESNATTEFKDIANIEFEVVNEHLIKAKIVTDAAKDKFTEFDIYRWHMIIDKPGEQEDIYDYIMNKGVFVFGNYVDINGSPSIYGPNAAIIFRNDIVLNGGTISTKNIYINGNITLKGNATLGNSEDPSKIFVSGIISGQNNTNVFGEVIEADDFVFPSIMIPDLKDAGWYTARGYTSNSSERDNMKFYGGPITLKKNATDVIIVSSGKIELRNKINVSGILFAPYDTVEIDTDTTFRGLIIANRVSINNKANVTFEPVEMDDLPF